MASGHARAELRLLCTFLWFYLLFSGFNYHHEFLKSPTNGLFIGTSVSSPVIVNKYPSRVSIRHRRASPTSQVVISTGLKIFKQSGIAICLLLMAGDLEVNPGPLTNCSYELNLGIKTKGLVITHLNIRSLMGKLDEVKLMVLTNTKTIDVLTLSETWLNASISDAEINLCGYISVRKNRFGDKRGGGTLIYIRDGLPFRIRDDLNSDETECLWIEINRTKSKPVIIGCAYRAPDFDLAAFISYLENISPYIGFRSSDVILLGDFNVDFSRDRRSPAKRKLLDFIRSLDCSQLLDKPTRITDSSKSLIDLILSTMNFVL